MVRIRVSKDELDLFYIIFNNCFIDYNIENFIIVKEEKLNIIVEKIGDYFIRCGLDKNDNPNKIGEKIELLQDKFLQHIK